MKKLLTIITLFTCVPFASADNLDKAREEVKNYFISDSEPKVIDAIWTSSNTFKVGVINDNTNRDGYAQYVCLELYDRGFKGKNVMVRVVDIQKLVQTGEWVNLGTAFCSAK
ncbi:MULTISPECIES: hypothetical protein [Pasteurellaceae]|uniref:Uncharacterized protein n=1 Tax=Pasteurella atlantica TaxID=2827233 RepID=A0AAW8CIQ5_9PAST|nr:hypothetical protein [Pasteurella atlantica]MBR0573367.1 hypothetical protein [Pasteurella atlantica]MDP8039825.1 hypothetical protein [Pasteurella atlantica]MDP8041842.1 hypothetical protein [Pasteurella atlantica]MDP8043909.1 hypothetical protein [Pasteurella atlantica]MDP8046088.1 hypothetical protein [Pasteurella atlantica]